MSKEAQTRVAIGVLPAVLLKVLAGERSFSPEESIVLAAIRRSNSDLTNASVDQIAEHVRSMTPEQLAGFQNNVKGIYHELRYVERENTDGDDVEAEMYEVVNHPGADVRLVNVTTGETVDIQLKATDSMTYVREHQERYPDVQVQATEEVASSAGVVSSGFNNSELAGDVGATVEKLDDDGSGEAGVASTELEAGVASGILSGVANARAALRGERTGPAAVRRTLEDMGIGVGSAALLELLVG